MEEQAREALSKELLADREKFQQLSHDFHKHYRASATAISVTVIGLSSAGMVALKDIPIDPSWFKLIPLPFMVTTVLLGIYVQYLHFSGYKHQARWADQYLTYVAMQLTELKNPADGQPDTKQEIWKKQREAWKSFRESRDWFDKLDDWTPKALGSFVATFAIFAITTGAAFVLEKPPLQSVLSEPLNPLAPSAPTPIGPSSLVFCIRSINWQAVAAVATLLAVIVALLPIWLEFIRRRAYARNLRLRLCSKLTLLRPTLRHVIQKGHTKYPGAVMEPDKFRASLALLTNMMQESHVLRKDEQDQLGVALVNLEHAALTFGTPDLHPESAKNTLDLLDKATQKLESHGLLHGKVEIPWKE